MRGYPAIIFADRKGRVVGKIRGYLPPESFAATMSQIARIHRELPAIQAKYDANPQDLETAGLLASAYATRGDVKRAKKFVKVLEEADSEACRDQLAQAYLALGDYYIDKENYRSAAKTYAKAAETSNDVTQVADARINLAFAYFSERLRFPPGSRAAKARLKKAERELVALMQIADLPDDRKTQAQQLLETVKKAGQ